MTTESEETAKPPSSLAGSMGLSAAGDSTTIVNC